MMAQCGQIASFLRSLESLADNPEHVASKEELAGSLDGEADWDMANLMGGPDLGN